MRCKIMRIQKLMWRNIMSSTKSQKASVLHYSINSLFLFGFVFLFLAKSYIPTQIEIP